MILEHVAIWSKDIEKLKAFYCRYFGAVSNELYHNASKSFKSYFLNFETGARLEIMQKPAIPGNLNDTIVAQHLGIIHLAFDVHTMQNVNDKAIESQNDGFTILGGPRKTGDGYYEFETLDPDNNRLEVTTNYTA